MRAVEIYGFYTRRLDAMSPHESRVIGQACESHVGVVLLTDLYFMISYIHTIYRLQPGVFIPCTTKMRFRAYFI